MFEKSQSLKVSKVGKYRTQYNNKMFLTNCLGSFSPLNATHGLHNRTLSDPVHLHQHSICHLKHRWQFALSLNVRLCWCVGVSFPLCLWETLFNTSSLLNHSGQASLIRGDRAGCIHWSVVGLTDNSLAFRCLPVIYIHTHTHTHTHTHIQIHAHTNTHIHILHNAWGHLIRDSYFYPHLSLSFPLSLSFSVSPSSQPACSVVQNHVMSNGFRRRRVEHSNSTPLWSRWL